jgi:hypothetical protein
MCTGGWVWNWKLNLISPLPLMPLAIKKMLPPLIWLRCLLICKLGIKQECRQLHLLWFVASNISLCLGIIAMVALLGVISQDPPGVNAWGVVNQDPPWVNVRDVPKGAKVQHPLCNILQELFNLLMNVVEKSVAQLSANEHDGVDRDFSQIHLHRCS